MTMTSRSHLSITHVIIIINSSTEARLLVDNSGSTVKGNSSLLCSLNWTCLKEANAAIASVSVKLLLCGPPP